MKEERKEERKEVRIERSDIFPENMEIKEILIGVKVGKGYYETQTKQKGESLDELLINIVNCQGNFVFIENKIANVLWEKIKKDLRIEVDEDKIRKLISAEIALSVVKKCFYSGYAKFCFDVTTINMPKAKQ